MSDTLTLSELGWSQALPVTATMRAMLFRRFGPPDVLEQATVDTPRPGPGEVLVQVAAVGIGRLLDLTARAGNHPYATIEPPHILGADHAGTVAELGEGVGSVEVGDRVAVLPGVACGTCAYCADGREEVCDALTVIGTHRPGAYAQYCVVPAGNVHKVPDGIPAAMAASLALLGAVAANQMAQAGLRPGHWVLVQGASSALGSTTAAYAQHLGAKIISTSRSAEKRAAMAAAGADLVLDTYAPDFVDRVREATGGRGVDIAVDNLGDPAVWNATIDSLARGGAVVTSGAFLGGQVEINLRRVYSDCHRIIGVRTGNPAAVAELWTQVQNGFRAVVDRTFPIARAADAHRYMEDDNCLGRVALTLRAEDWDA
ncbi:zinc-binding dehydrogenase [Streptomyces sp. ME02-8801-2C]|uniref:alcohol dehydrogenase catalytic domain-containing protein n=1 Tax=Streptomyces sp. ME02-8801-2C TaxID=3028680 RepID=UPI0029A5C1E4|nr:alcohol dehydrogenase catalytic domain-containing protein [Streptomyces sp. ME02-8801-2C]MDX3452601.1 zinc-binding dehydrogenase [Streptomyces sp. ME02-8801-2C]